MKDAQVCIGIQVGDLMRDGYNVYGWGCLGVFKMLLLSILRRVAVSCILTSAILRLIWDPGITVTGSLVIDRECFQEVSCNGTSFTSWLVTLLIGGFRGTFCDGVVQCSPFSRGCYRSPRIIWDPGIIPGFSWFSWLTVDLRWHCLRTSNLWRGRTVMFRFYKKGITED